MFFLQKREKALIVDMKAIHITLDERLLEKLNNDEEVKQEGRSAVIRLPSLTTCARSGGQRLQLPTAVLTASNLRSQT